MTDNVPSSDPGAAAEMEVRNNLESQRFEILIGDERAFLQYERHPKAITLVHTEVPPALRGRGLANVLAKFALDTARAEGLRIVATCPSVQAYMRKHPEP